MFNRRELYILTLMMMVISIPASASRAESGVVESAGESGMAIPAADSGQPQGQDMLQSAPSSTSQEATPPQNLPTIQANVQENPIPSTESDPVDSGARDVGKKVAEINERMALLSAQLAELELKAKIATKVSEIADIANKDKKDKKNGSANSLDIGGSFVGQGSNSVSRAIPQMPLLRSGSSMPVVKSVEGIDGNLKASLEVKGEGVRTVHVGDKVAGWTVQNIRVDAVTVQKGKTVQDLYFGSSNSENDSLLMGGRAGPGMPSVLGGGLSSSMGIEPLTYRE